MLTRADYFDAFVRSGRQGKFNLTLAVKGYPRLGEVTVDEGLELGSAILAVFERMTPAQVLMMFPLKKEFDGSQYGEKDYFYSRNFIKEYGLGKRIVYAPEFIMEYCNDDIIRFLVSFQVFCGQRYHERTGRSMACDGMEYAKIPYNAITGDGLYLIQYDGETHVEVPNLPMWKELGLI